MIATIVAVAVFVIFVLFIVLMKMSFAATLDVLVVPTEARVLVNGQEYQNGVYEGLMAGTVQVEISLEGFETQQFELELKRNETTRLYTYLKGNESWYQNADENNLKMLDIILEHEGELETKKLTAKYPIMKDLPMVYENYTDGFTKYVSYRIDGGQYAQCKQEFCVKITDISGGSYETALKTMQSYGYSPSNYEIIYEDASQNGHAE